MEKAKLEHKETSSEEDEPKTPKSSARSEKDSKEKDLESIIEEERSKVVERPDKKLGMKFKFFSQMIVIICNKVEKLSNQLIKSIFTFI